MSEEKDIVKCVGCNKEYDRDEDEIWACEHCGDSVCKNCATLNKDGDYFCKKCTESMVKTDLYVIELDETKYWQKDFLKENKIKAITSVYVFDKNAHTYCCEMSYSYWLVWLYDNVVMEDDTTDDEHEHAIEMVENTLRDDECAYYSHYDIDAKIERLQKQKEGDSSDNFDAVHKLDDDENFTYFPVQEGGLGENAHTIEENEEYYKKHFDEVAEDCQSTHYL